VPRRRHKKEPSEVTVARMQLRAAVIVTAGAVLTSILGVLQELLS
jgi:hypothetical protein